MMCRRDSVDRLSLSKSQPAFTFVIQTVYSSPDGSAGAFCRKTVMADVGVSTAAAGHRPFSLSEVQPLKSNAANMAIVGLCIMRTLKRIERSKRIARRRFKHETAGLANLSPRTGVTMS